MITMEELTEMFDDHQLHHSEFQMDNFITVRAGETTYGQYKQALRELFKRYRGLKELYTSKEKLKIDLEEFEYDISDITDYTIQELPKMAFKRRRLVIDLGKLRMDMEDLERNLNDTEREFKRFYAQCENLKKRVGELTPEKRHQLDMEMWEHKLLTMAAVDYMTRGGLSENTLTFVRSTPQEWKREVLPKIEPRRKNELINWFHSYSNPVKDLEIDTTTNPATLLGTPKQLQIKEK